MSDWKTSPVTVLPLTGKFAVWYNDIDDEIYTQPLLAAVLAYERTDDDDGRSDCIRTLWRSIMKVSMKWQSVGLFRYGESNKGGLGSASCSRTVARAQAGRWRRVYSQQRQGRLPDLSRKHAESRPLAR
jgi:hypothetical protein